MLLSPQFSIFDGWSTMEKEISSLHKLHHYSVCEDTPLLWRDWLWAAALCGVLLTPVPLIGHECLVDGKVLDIGL